MTTFPRFLYASVRSHRPIAHTLATSRERGSQMPLYEKGNVRIHYQEAGSVPWKDTKEKIPLAVRHVRTFLKANRQA